MYAILEPASEDIYAALRIALKDLPVLIEPSFDPAYWKTSLQRISYDQLFKDQLRRCDLRLPSEIMLTKKYWTITRLD